MTTKNSLLVEIRTEELPPLLLWTLADDFPDKLLKKLTTAGFADQESHRASDEKNAPKKLATPRRLIALLENIREKTPPREIILRGPRKANAWRDGAPTKALAGFLRGANATADDLQTIEEKGGEYVAVQKTEPARALQNELAKAVEEVLFSLNAPRLMRWGENEFKFIRPVRGVLMMWKKEIINGTVMNVAAEKTTVGHRFLGAQNIAVKSADDYEKTMRAENVIADIEKRAEIIKAELEKKTKTAGGIVFSESDSPSQYHSRRIFFNNEFLLGEVAAMCESPFIFCGEIDSRFAKLPAHCVAVCMQQHQRFFPLADKNGLLPKFLAVADNQPSDKMINGYAAVLSARLADVEFFINEDKKTSLEENLEKLKTIIYHKKLGNQFERTERIRKIASALAELGGVKKTDKQKIDDAAKICKADLTTLMINEYPQLEGYIAADYFCNPVASADANSFDQPSLLIFVRHHNDIIQKSPLFYLCAANHLEKLVGFFGVGEKPSGNKDPHGLRRTAANIAAIIGGPKSVNIGLDNLINAARQAFGGLPDYDGGEVYNFIVERARAYFLREFSAPSVNAVFAKRLQHFSGVYEKLNSLQFFQSTDYGGILVAANKRINNILRKSNFNIDGLPKIDAALFQHDREKNLYEVILRMEKENASRIEAEKFDDAMLALSGLAMEVDDFFDKVLINCEDKKIRDNRAALLFRLRALLNQVADISQLAV